MESIVGKYEFMIDAYLSDFRGKATLPMIGGFMLQAATKHAEERGFGYSAMTSKRRAWVLSRIAIELFEYPANDTIMVIKTWVSNVNRLFTERFFAFENQNGKKIGYAKSLWAAIDMENRKPTNVLELEDLVNFVTTEEDCPIQGLTKIPLLKDNFETAGEFTVRYSDIDINKHLNSMKYIEHIVDVFDINMFKEKEIKRFEINYLSEGKYASEIKIIKQEEEDCQFILEMRNGETILSATRITWK